jgi:hypothetical protein
VVLYMMATGAHPFHADNDAGTLNNIANGKMIRPSEIAPEISPDLEAIILTALANSPSDRYQTAARMCEDLEEMIEAHTYKAGPAQLSRLMHGVFLAEIEEHERKIRDYRRERGEETGITSVPPPPAEGESQPKLAVSDIPDLPADALDGFSMAPPPRAKRKYALIGAGVTALVAIAAVVLIAVGTGEPAKGSAQGATSGAAAAKPEPPRAPEAPPAVPSDGPKEIRLDLGALPLGAQVTLDGQGIEYPFALPASPKAGRLRVTAPGYNPFEATIPLDRDREVKVVWERESAASQAAVKPKGPSAGGKPKGKKPEGENKGSSEKEVLLPSPFD